MADLAELLTQYRSAQCPQADARLTGLFDDGSYSETGRIYAAAGRTPTLVTAGGKINGAPAYAFSQDSSTDGGAFDQVQASKAASLYELAARNGVPLVGIYDSKGSYVADGAAALNGYSLVLSKAAEISGVVPVIAVIDGICAGSMALIAMTADIVVITEKSELYLDVNRRYDGKAAAEAGLAAKCVKDMAAASAFVREYLSHMPSNNLDSAPCQPYGAEDEKILQTAKDILIEGTVTGLYNDCGTEVYTALGAVWADPANSITANIGVCCLGNGGKVADDGLAKAARFARLCDAFNIPLVTVTDCEGADLSDADMTAHRSFVQAAAAYAEASVPKIAVVKKAIGAVFTAFAGKNISADTVIALDDALISPIAPLTAAEFLSHDKLAGSSDTAADRQALADAYARDSASGYAAAACGAADMVLSTAELSQAIGDALSIAGGKRLAKRIPRKHSTL